MEIFLDFDPLIKNSFLQTTLGSSFGFELNFASKTHLVTLPDGDRIALEISRPPLWKETDEIILMLHGLCGSHKSRYLKRMGKRFYRMGKQVIRMNFRGSGSGRGLAKGIYHSGSSPDVEVVLRHLKQLFPKAKIVLIAVSLGANISLKLAGELNTKGPDFIHSLIAISPPADLLASVRLLLKPHNRFYANYFLKVLLNNVHYLHSRFKDLPTPEFPSDINIIDFDEYYTAPRAHFHSSLEYYRACSAKNFVPDIKIPTKILFAKDDPIISASALDRITLPEEVQVYKTEFGGHLGYMGKNLFSEFRWMDNVIINWVEESLNPKS
jgi:predicted alpha/beta-fold hydrolase